MRRNRRNGAVNRPGTALYYREGRYGDAEPLEEQRREP
jgi:hypothetical protein